MHCVENIGKIELKIKHGARVYGAQIEGTSHNLMKVIRLAAELLNEN